MSGPALRYADEPRAARLGASEVAAVLGLSPWQTAFGVWSRKLGAADAPETGVTRRGRYLESAVLDWLRDDLDAEMFLGGPFDSPWVVSANGRWPHVGCHPDAYVRPEGKPWQGAEAKTARAAREWGDADDAVPPGYWLQAQVGLALTGLPLWHLAVYLPIAEKFRRYPIAPDTATTCEALDRCEAWWDRHVTRDEPPEPDASDEARRWLLSTYPRAITPLRDATDAEALLAREVADLRVSIREAETRERAVSARLTAAIGEAEGLRLPGGGRVTWRAQTTERIDVARVRAEHPEVARACTARTETRVLRVSMED